jgi:hypothetical protein
MSTIATDLRAVSSSNALESPVSAISWPAIVAGAAIAAATSLLLLALGSGLGFASLSPWQGEGPSATTFTVMTAIWFIVVQWISSAFGGYLTGRTRTKWVGVHSHEVTFRDTAHGLATWAVATLATSAIVAVSTVAVISGGAKVAASAAAGAGQAGAAALSSTANAGEIGGYQVDTLFRSTSAAAAASPETRSEVLQILAKGVRDGDIAADDRKYLSELIAAKTGIAQPEAEQRVNSAIEQVKAASVKARELADAARKTAAAAAICTALSMLIGAFIAMVAAALGGRERDLHV